MPKMLRVLSSSLYSVGYEENDLFIKFQSGITYVYYEVTSDVYMALINANSKGRFLNQYIKGYYWYKKL